MPVQVVTITTCSLTPNHDSKDHPEAPLYLFHVYEILTVGMHDETHSCFSTAVKFCELCLCQFILFVRTCQP